MLLPVGLEFIDGQWKLISSNCFWDISRKIPNLLNFSLSSTMIFLSLRKVLRSIDSFYCELKSIKFLHSLLCSLLLFPLYYYWLLFSIQKTLLVCFIFLLSFTYYLLLLFINQHQNWNNSIFISLSINTILVACRLITYVFYRLLSNIHALKNLKKKFITSCQIIKKLQDVQW